MDGHRIWDEKKDWFTLEFFHVNILLYYPYECNMVP